MRKWAPYEGVRHRRESTGRLVLKKTVFFCVGEYVKYGFDQQRLIWYVFRLCMGYGV